MKIKNFWDLEVWQEARALTIALYNLTRSFPKAEQFGLTAQMKRASISIMANIAEGFGRYHYRDKARFYYQARGSLLEIQNFVLVARDLGLIDSDVASQLMSEGKHIQKVLNGLINAVISRS